MKRTGKTAAAGAAAALLLIWAGLPGAGGAVRPVAGPAPPRPLVVAAENFYGDVVGQVAGDRAAVTSILDAPNADPHEYEPNAAAAAAVARARLVVMNGLGYDAFMSRLVAASPNPGRAVIVVGDLLGRAGGDNPHLWYDPATMPRLARAAATALGRLDPADRGVFEARLLRFQASFRSVTAEIAAMRARRAGTPVALTEPVFAYMARALGLRVLTPEAFQRAVEEGRDPPASAVAEMEEQLRTRRVRVLLYNLQTVTPITARMRRLASASGIPVVGVWETEPAGTDYQRWMLDQLAALDAALSGRAK